MYFSLFQVSLFLVNQGNSSCGSYIKQYYALCSFCFYFCQHPLVFLKNNLLRPFKIHFFVNKFSIISLLTTLSVFDYLLVVAYILDYSNDHSDLCVLCTFLHHYCAHVLHFPAYRNIFKAGILPNCSLNHHQSVSRCSEVLFIKCQILLLWKKGILFEWLGIMFL